MSKLPSAINFKQWIEDNRHLLKPPVANKAIVHEDFIVMVVGGPNNRKDYHYNETPEFFYQIEGDMILKIQENGEQRDIEIKEGEIFYLPPSVPHSPQRFANTVGLVIEQKRADKMKDGLEWYCENCNHKLHHEPFLLQNIEVDLPVMFEKFYSNEELRTCDSCGHIMEAP